MCKTLFKKVLNFLVFLGFSTFSTNPITTITIIKKLMYVTTPFGQGQTALLLKIYSSEERNMIKMKFKVQKSILMDVLNPAMNTVSTKNTIASIEGILFESMEDGSIRISTYDMNKGIRATFMPCAIEREGKFVINAQRLYQTVRVLPEDEITIDVNDNLNCNIYCGKASFSIFAQNGDIFPNLPDMKSEDGFVIKSSILKKMIGKVMHSVAVQDNRVMLMGAYFVITKDMIQIVSCDSFNLSKCEMKCTVTSLKDEDMKYKFIVPGNALSELTKIIPDDDDFDIVCYLFKKRAVFEAANVCFFTRVIDSEYIDYNRIIPKDNDIFVTVDKERLLSGLERANIIAEEKIQGSGRSYVKILIENNFLTLTSTSVNGKVADEMECEQKGRDIEIGFNCRYLINSIKAAEGEKLVLGFKSPTNAVTIEALVPSEDFTYFYMVLPVRMNEKKNED